MQTDSTKTNPIIISINLISQITNQLSKYSQQNLHILDRSVIAYIQARNISKLQSYANNNNNPSSPIPPIDYLSQQGLQQLHKKSQLQLLALQTQLQNYNKLKDTINQSNTRILQDITNISDQLHIIQLCKQIIIQLSKYKDIQLFWDRLLECKNKINKIGHGGIVEDVQRYLDKVDGWFSDDSNQSKSKSQDQDQNSQYFSDQDQEVGNSKFTRIGKNGRTALLLDFIQ